MFHTTQASDNRRLDIAATLSEGSSDWNIYVCGPQPFIEAVKQSSAQAGIPESHFHTEYFAAVEHDDNEDCPFEVEIASTGEIIKVAKEVTLLEALEEQGHFIPVACEEGVCGTCITGLKAGTADHRDVFQSDEEKRAMTHIAPCCSRAKSRLILDL